MSVGLNRASVFYYSNPNRFQAIMKSEKILRRIDDVYLIDSSGNVMFSETKEINSEFLPPTEEEFDKALEGLPVIISNNLDRKTSVMIKLSNLIDTILYISRDKFSPAEIKSSIFPLKSTVICRMTVELFTIGTLGKLPIS